MLWEKRVLQCFDKKVIGHINDNLSEFSSEDGSAHSDEE